VAERSCTDCKWLGQSIKSGELLNLRECGWQGAMPKVMARGSILMSDPFHDCPTWEKRTSTLEEADLALIQRVRRGRNGRPRR
jgi:hypothetical protein